MQFVVAHVERQALPDQPRRRVEDHQQARPARVHLGCRIVDRHHHDPGPLMPTVGDREADHRPHPLGRTQPEQPRRGTQPEQVEGLLVGAPDVVGRRLQPRVGEQRGEHVPGGRVVPLGRQPGGEPVVGHREVEVVEPVAGVVRVPVEALAAQDVRARVPHHRALAERGHGEADSVHPHPGGHRRGRVELQGERVEEGLVVVRVHVADHLAGGVRVAGRTFAEVEVCAAELGVPRVRSEPERPQRAGQTELDQVGVPGQALTLNGLVTTPAGPVVRGEQPGAEALTARVTVPHRAAADGVAQAVGEGGDPGAAELTERRLGEPGVVGHLTEVPPLAVHGDGAPVHPVPLGGERVQRRPDGEHVVAAVMPHQVEAEAVHVVAPDPVHARIHHQLLGHQVLGGHVRAAGRGFHPAERVQPVVVAGHDPVEHRLRVLAGARGVVEHLVEHDPQPGGVEGSDHLPELDDPAGALGTGQRGRERALRREVVPRVVAPVETTAPAGGVHLALLFRAVRRKPLQVLPGRPDLEGGMLLHGRVVEQRQQLHRVQARLGEPPQVGHAGAVDGGREEAPAKLGRNGGVRDREVAQVQFVDHLVDRVGERRGDRIVPLPGDQRGVGQVDQHRVRGVHGERGGVRVGHLVDHHPAVLRGVDRDLVAVPGVDPARLAGDRPGAVRGRDHPAPLRSVVEFRARGPQQQRDLARRRSPQPQRRRTEVPGRPQFRGGGVAVTLVDDAGQLELPGRGEPAGRQLCAHRQLAAQRLPQVERAVRHPQAQVVTQVRERGGDVRGQAVRVEAKGGGGPWHRLAGRRVDVVVSRGVQAPVQRGRVLTGRQLRAGPGDQVHAQPVPWSLLKAPGVLDRPKHPAIVPPIGVIAPTVRGRVPDRFATPRRHGKHRGNGCGPGPRAGSTPLRGGSVPSRGRAGLSRAAGHSAHRTPAARHGCRARRSVPRPAPRSRRHRGRC